MVEERSRDGYGRRIVSRVVTDLLRERVDLAWENGWQPVDLDRFVGRVVKTAGADPARRRDGRAPDAVRREHRRREWWDQMADLEARVWWPADRNWMLARGAAGDWCAVVLQSVRLIARVWLIPRIEKLGPAPGEATAESVARDRREVDPRILERVRRLLAKAESTTFAAEAETFTAGAQSLMARQSIDAAFARRVRWRGERGMRRHGDEQVEHGLLEEGRLVGVQSGEQLCGDVGVQTGHRVLDLLALLTCLLLFMRRQRRACA